MAKTIKISICHLYPDLMDTYGDWGNIQTLVKRCLWRNIETEVTNLSLDEKIEKDFDIYFFGGGQDKTQEIVSRDLMKNKKELKKVAADGVVILSICGGYQLLLEYFKTIDGKTLEGLGIFQGYTLGSQTRMIGNIQIKLNDNLKEQISTIYPTSDIQHPISDIVGFENHSGKTFVDSNISPLGEILKGSGNNGEDGTEGAVYKNAFGCYMHGSLLPKNPHFADYLIAKALNRHYPSIKLEPLDDSIEWYAHKSAVARL